MRCQEQAGSQRTEPGWEPGDHRETGILGRCKEGLLLSAARNEEASS